MAAGAYQAYRQVDVETASPHKLVTMLYEGAIRRCREAVRAFEAGNNAEATRLLYKAQDIIAELLTNLDREKGGELAAELAEHYLFMYDLLVKANIKRDAKSVGEVADLLSELLSAWKQIG